MTSLTPYLYFPGTTRAALEFYAGVFDGSAELHTLEDFGRTDGPPEAIAHGILTGPVSLFAADATGDQPAFRSEGMMFSLLGTASPSTLHTWFDRLAEGGQVLDPMQAREWGATDGRLVDRHGLHWVVGYEATDTAG